MLISQKIRKGYIFTKTKKFQILSTWHNCLNEKKIFLRILNLKNNQKILISTALFKIIKYLPLSYSLYNSEHYWSFLKITLEEPKKLLMLINLIKSAICMIHGVYTVRPMEIFKNLNFRTQTCNVDCLNSISCMPGSDISSRA